jgi:hypothetical protein
MAEQTVHDVVKEALSVDAPSSIGDIATSSIPALAGSGQASTEPNALFGNDQVHNIEIAGLGREFAKSPLSEKALQAEASGGSDTDTSRNDGLKDTAGGHARSNSVKKPATFKSVSVTKNFLAKTAVGGPNIKSNDKGKRIQTAFPIVFILTAIIASSAQPTPTMSLNAKPRLVAKSALGGLGSRSGLSGTKGPGTGPDASKVWNKNRGTSRYAQDSHLTNLVCSCSSSGGQTIYGRGTQTAVWYTHGDTTASR